MGYTGTTNYGFQKPAKENAFTVDDLNNALDKIDETIKTQSNSASSSDSALSKRITAVEQKNISQDNAIAENSSSINKLQKDIEDLQDTKFTVMDIGISYTPLDDYVLNVTQEGSYNGAQLRLCYSDFPDKENDWFYLIDNKPRIVHEILPNDNNGLDANMYASRYVSATGPALTFYAITPNELGNTVSTSIYWTTGIPRNMTLRNEQGNNVAGTMFLNCNIGINVISNVVKISDTIVSNAQWHIYQINMPNVNETSTKLQPMASNIGYSADVGTKSCRIGIDCKPTILSKTLPEVVNMSEDGLYFSAELSQFKQKSPLVYNITVSPIIYYYTNGSYTYPFAITFNEDLVGYDLDTFELRLSTSANGGGTYADYKLYKCPYKDHTYYLSMIDSSSAYRTQVLTHIRFLDVKIDVPVLGTWTEDNWTTNATGLYN